MITSTQLMGQTLDEYLTAYGQDDHPEATKAYTKYMKQFDEIADAINNKNVLGLKRLANQYDMPTEDYLHYLSLM